MRFENAREREMRLARRATKNQEPSPTEERRRLHCGYAAETNDKQVRMWQGPNEEVL